MRISDWRSDVCSSDLSEAPFSPRSCTAAASWASLTFGSRSSVVGTEYRWRLDKGQKYSVLPSADSAMPSEATVSVFGLPPGPLVMSACCPSPNGLKSGSGEVDLTRSEEQTSALLSLMRISYAAFCLK